MRPGLERLALLLARVSVLLRQIATVMDECGLVGWAGQCNALAQELDEHVHELDEETDPHVRDQRKERG